MFSMKKRLNLLLKIPGRAWMKSHLHLNPKSSRMQILTFFTSFDVHFGQLVSCSEAFMLWSNVNFSLHFKQIYSYIGISDSL